MYLTSEIWDLHKINIYSRLGPALPHSTRGFVGSMNLFKEAAKNKFVFFLTLLGILIFILSLLSDLFGFGKEGIGRAQLSAAGVGAILAILGVGLMLARQENVRAAIRSSWLAGIPGLPNIVWVMIGFFIAYVIFLIVPMFFDPVHRLVYFDRYLPDVYPIGGDFTTTLDSIRTWFAEGIASVYYPPLLTILFAPFLLIPYPTNYYIITIITVVSYFIAAFLLPLLIVEKGNRSIIPFIFGVSVLSYGFQFELERGQFHTIALLLCISAIYLFHRYPQRRFFAYLLFCMSVQFKIYPALFVVMFVDDWRDWKINLKRFAGLGLANFLLLFLLGYSYFSKFIAHIIASSGSPEAWNGNHSIISFFYYLLDPKTRLLDANSMARLDENIHLITNLFLAYFAVCFLVVWMNTHRRNKPGIDPFLMMTCVLGGLLIPAINHDYTLPLLTTPFALTMSEQFTRNGPRRILVILLLVASSFTYTATLVSYIRKPLYLQNSFPLLIILLTTTTLLSFLRDKEEITPVAAA